MALDSWPAADAFADPLDLARTPTWNDEPLEHGHDFRNPLGERNAVRVRAAVLVSLAAMGVEIGVGLTTRSLALIAEGLHLASHVGLLAIAWAAYRYAHHRRADARFSFGLGKLGDLTAFASALLLGVVALGLGWEGTLRLLRPQPAAYGPALTVAALGVGVNLLVAGLLWDRSGEGVRDLNLRAAFAHVASDVGVSLLAVAGLTAGVGLGWSWADPAAGLVGAASVMLLAVVLLRSAAANLLDSAVRKPAEDIRRRLERDGARVTDLHVWRLGPGHLGVIASVSSQAGLTPSDYKARLADVPGLSHVTVEVNAPERTRPRSAEAGLKRK